MKLDAGKVVEARAKEVTYLRDKRVYDKIPRHQALKSKWKIIRTRWVNINKGDDENSSIAAGSSARSSMAGRWTASSRALHPSKP